MNPIALARMGLMGLGKLRPWLTRGTGWGRKAKGPPGTPGTAGVLGPGTRPIPGTAGLRGSRPIPPGDIGLRTVSGAHPISGAGTASVRGTPGLPPGIARRHPILAGAAGTSAALGATTGIYGALGGEEEVVRPTLPQQKAAWAAPEDLLSFSEQAKADAEKGKSDMKKMLKYGFLIAAAGGDPSKFFERASEVGKMTAAYTKDERYAKQYDAVFRKGDMPDTPQVAYRRLTDVGMGPKEAMEITGQVAQLMGKTETERALNNLRNVLASQGEEAAASLLMMYWSTGQLEGAPEYAKEDELRQAALAAVRGGGLGATEPTGEEIGEITLA